MVVIRHEAVRQYTYETFRPVLINKTEAVLVVVGTEEDIALVRTAIEDMVVFAVFVLHGTMSLLQDILPKASVELGEPSEGYIPQSLAYLKSTLTVRYETFAISGGRRLNWFF